MKTKEAPSNIPLQNNTSQQNSKRNYFQNQNENKPIIDTPKKPKNQYKLPKTEVFSGISFGTFDTQRLLKILGVFTMLFSAFLLVAFMSHLFFYGPTDQSLIEGGTAQSAENKGGYFGAIFSQILITQGFGFSSVVLPFYLFIFGYAVYSNDQWSLVKKLFSPILFGVYWTATALAYIKITFSLPFMDLGGGVGISINEWISIYIGQFGVGLVLVFSLLVYLNYQFKKNIGSFGFIGYWLAKFDSKFTQHTTPTTDVQENKNPEKVKNDIQQSTDEKQDDDSVLISVRKIKVNETTPEHQATNLEEKYGFKIESRTERLPKPEELPEELESIDTDLNQQGDFGIADFLHKDDEPDESHFPSPNLPINSRENLPVNLVVDDCKDVVTSEDFRLNEIIEDSIPEVIIEPLFEITIQRTETPFLEPLIISKIPFKKEINNDVDFIIEPIIEEPLIDNFTTLKPVSQAPAQYTLHENEITNGRIVNDYTLSNNSQSSLNSGIATLPFMMIEIPESSDHITVKLNTYQNLVNDVTDSQIIDFSELKPLSEGLNFGFELSEETDEDFKNENQDSSVNSTANYSIEWSKEDIEEDLSLTRQQKAVKDYEKRRLSLFENFDSETNDSIRFIITDTHQDNIEEVSPNTFEKIIPLPDLETLTDEEDVVNWETFEAYDPTKDLSLFEFPTIDLLNAYDNGNKREVDHEELQLNKQQIVRTLSNYGIEITSIKATIGPTITLYEIVPAAGVRISKIKNLEDDIALSLSALGIRIIAPMPGKGTIGIEIPNNKAEMVSFRSVVATEKFKNTDAILPIAIGKTISNEVYVFDLAKMPHLLVAGATGQGKSVGLNTIIASLLYKKHPSQVKFVLIDPKKVEMSLYQALQYHYLAKLPNLEDAIITDNKDVVHVLNSLCKEMDDRYLLLQEAKVRNIVEYNEKFTNRKLNPKNGHKYLPYIVLIIDELADLMFTAGKEIETPIARLAQLARAIGIHLVVATQRPSVNVITGLIKANFPARISYRVTQRNDSRTILDANGAERLIGKGDLLLSKDNELTRVQNAFIDTPEVDRIVEHIAKQQRYSQPYMLPDVSEADSNEANSGDNSERDPLFDESARLLVNLQSGSTSSIQQHLKIGYNRAARIMLQLEKAGIVSSPGGGNKPREILVKSNYDLEHFL